MDETEIYKVIEGSGMGLTHSSLIASLSFIKRVESVVLTQQILDTYQIVRYIRYHDDTMVLYRDKPLFRQFVALMKQHANHFKIICSQASSVSVDFLDLTVRLGSSKIEVVPTLTKLPSPLHVSSGHAPHVHKAWPIAVANRVIALSGDVPAIEQLHDLYRKGNASPLTLSIFRNFCYPHKSAANQHTETSHISATIWLLVGFHPAFARCLNKCLAEIPRPFSVSNLGNMRIAWRNSLPNLQQQFSKINRGTLGRMVGCNGMD